MAGTVHAAHRPTLLRARMHGWDCNEQSIFDLESDVRAVRTELEDHKKKYPRHARSHARTHSLIHAECRYSELATMSKDELEAKMKEIRQAQYSNTSQSPVIATMTAWSMAAIALDSAAWLGL